MESKARAPSPALQLSLQLQLGIQAIWTQSASSRIGRLAARRLVVVCLHNEASGSALRLEVCARVATDARHTKGERARESRLHANVDVSEGADLQ